MRGIEHYVTIAGAFRRDKKQKGRKRLCFKLETVWAARAECAWRGSVARGASLVQRRSHIRPAFRSASGLPGRGGAHAASPALDELACQKRINARRAKKPAGLCRFKKDGRFDGNAKL
jgi:hypothetical protein